MHYNNCCSVRLWHTVSYFQGKNKLQHFQIKLLKNTSPKRDQLCMKFWILHNDKLCDILEQFKKSISLSLSFYRPYFVVWMKCVYAITHCQEGRFLGNEINHAECRRLVEKCTEPRTSNSEILSEKCFMPINV
jgi:hypothetical protein